METSIHLRPGRLDHFGPFLRLRGEEGARLRLVGSARLGAELGQLISVVIGSGTHKQLHESYNCYFFPALFW
jgi:hypothetical protein